MDFREAQDAAWQNKLAHGFNTTDVPRDILRTYGEITEAFEAWNQGDTAHFGEELADGAIYLLGLAEMAGRDLGNDVEAKLARNRNRVYELQADGRLVKVSDPGADFEAG